MTIANTDKGFIIKNTEPRTCREIHKLISGYVSAELSKMHVRLEKRYACQACGKVFRVGDYDEKIAHDDKPTLELVGVRP